jgi:hypothetical protein
MFTTTPYHSRKWAGLVEVGWITLEVNDGVATMLFVGKK